MKIEWFNPQAEVCLESVEKESSRNRAGTDKLYGKGMYLPGILSGDIRLRL